MKDCYIHHIPGRLRVKTPLLKRNLKTAGAARQLLLPIEGIASVEINIVTGSMVVRYEKSVTDPKEIFNLLKGGGYLDEAHPLTHDPVLRRAADKIGTIVVRAVFGAFLEAALKRPAGSIIAALL